MDSVERENDHHDEIRDEQGDVEGVPAIGVAEGVVGEVGAPVVAEAAIGGEQEGERVEVFQQRGLRGVRVQRFYARGTEI
jgi:hypothetical protein